ncbi:MAG TPA: hypothetical protein VHV47_15630 [Opitutaceae bacterium]|jgi:hypothetical protein|nr:hypothetical protein [Opitutaceae bacterium]
MRPPAPLRLVACLALIPLRLARADGPTPDPTRLLAALQALEQPRGCWAYTVTKQLTEKGVVTIDVERFNPTQPDSALWTLLSHNGTVPNAAAQASYRKKKLAWWKKEQARHRKLESQELTAKLRDRAWKLQPRAPENAGEIVFDFEKPKVSSLIVRVSRMHDTYAIAAGAPVLLRQVQEFPDPTSALGLRLDYALSEVDYRLVDPAYAPFVARTIFRGRFHAWGSDQGEVAVEKIYSDYKKVKCYQDRFEVQIGPSQVIEER